MLSLLVLKYQEGQQLLNIVCTTIPYLISHQDQGHTDAQRRDMSPSRVVDLSTKGNFSHENLYLDSPFTGLNLHPTSSLFLLISRNNRGGLILLKT